MSSAPAVKSVQSATLITDGCAKLLSNQTSLPSMPAVAARIHDAMASPNWSMRTIATIIKCDLGTTTICCKSPTARSTLERGRRARSSKALRASASTARATS